MIINIYKYEVFMVCLYALMASIERCDKSDTQLTGWSDSGGQ